MPPNRSNSRSHSTKKSSAGHSEHQHKKNFGQNFLNNDRIIQQIVASIYPKANQHLVEIGPGQAALTEPLLQVVKRLDIIEIDNDLIGPLTQKLAHFPAFHLHHQDALSFDYYQLVQPAESVEAARFRVVGNLPYNISSPLLFHLLNFADAIEDMHFMLQKEVVDRICAQPGSKTFGRLSVMLQYALQTEHLFDVGPENFNPPPKVNSAIVRLQPYRTKPYLAQNETLFAETVRRAFAQKRKTLRNNLKDWLSEAEIEACGIAPSQRAEQLSVADFVNLANYYAQHHGAVG